MTITAYSNFSKRINSTKRPSSGTNITVKLKAPCSTEKPTFILTGNLSNYNYIKWGNNYYYVVETNILSNDLYEIECDHDLLATYKSNILSTKAFIEYSSYSFNTDILDRRISNTGRVSRNTALDYSLIGFFGTGTFIVSLVGEDGIAKRYIMNSSNIRTLMSYINTVSDDNVLDAVVKKYGSLLNCIIGCTWVPFEPNNDGSLYPVKLGAYTVPNLSCHLCSQTLIAKSWTTNINIPWINSEIARNHTETMTLYLPGYGNAALETSKYIGLSQIKLDIVADITGGITYGLYNSGGTVDYYNVQLGAQIPITQFTQSPIGSLLSAASKGYASDARGETPFKIKGFSSFMENLTGRLQNVGSQASSIGGQGGISVGSMAQVYDTIALTNYGYQFSEAQADMADRYGRPKFAVDTLTNYTGYVKCNGASVECSAKEEEKEIINNYLNSGIFIE